VSTLTIADAALDYNQRRKWKPVPVSRKTKKPIGKEWQKRPFDPAQFNGNAQNIAIQLGAVSGELVDVDLDSVAAIGLAPEFLPQTDCIFGHKSKPCSHQLYVSDLHKVETRANISYPQFINGKAAAMIVELRVGGGDKGATTVVPPSMHVTGETVEWVRDGEPAWVSAAELIVSVRKLAVAALLATYYPGEGSRHEGALVIGGVFARVGWTADDITKVMAAAARANNDDDVRERVVTAVGAIAAKAKGEDVSGFERLREVWGDIVGETLAHWFRGQGIDAETLLGQFNTDYCVVPDGGKTLVLTFDRVENNAGGETYVHYLPSFMRFGDFRNLHLNRRVAIGNRFIDAGSWWLTHPQRRQYRGVTFTPGSAQVVNGKLNLWRGFGVEPIKGDWSLIEKHVREVLAAGDKRVAEYDIRWLAWAVQHPDQQPEVALVLLGERGTGKGTIGKAMCRIFGQHALHLSSSDHLTGRFNAHQRQCCFLFADESYAPNDKSAEGRLKRLITEDTLTIEPKGRDLVDQPNRLHVMIASNNDWVVPAGAYERRFVVQEISTAHLQEEKWFAPLYAQMRESGLNAMLYDLLNFPLGDWHPRRLISTTALSKQQEESLSPLDAWWLELLQTGTLAGADENNPTRVISKEYEEVITESTGSGGYGGYGGGSRTRTVKRNGLLDQARDISPRLKQVSDHKIGRYLNDRGCTRTQVRRHRGWQFPPLTKCRDDWCKRFPLTEWDDPALTEWEPEEP
jgi:uncharacterized protein DUF5906/bifunctional DNA primase/polymerase-like protein